MIGAQDGSYDITIPKRPIRRKIKGLPAFTTVKGGAYFFLPGIKALHYLAAFGGKILVRPAPRDRAGSSTAAVYAPAQ